jgi:hypothetical protein
VRRGGNADVETCGRWQLIPTSTLPSPSALGEGLGVRELSGTGGEEPLYPLAGVGGRITRGVGVGSGPEVAVGAGGGAVGIVTGTVVGTAVGAAVGITTGIVVGTGVNVGGGSGVAVASGAIVGAGLAVGGVVAVTRGADVGVG